MATFTYEPARPHMPPLARFEHQYIPEPNSGCWIWIGAVAGPADNERPRLWINGRSYPAHRFAHEIFHGPVPEGRIICHRCHNSLCVNPDHLYAGTHQDNTNDMMRAGRHYLRDNPSALEAAKDRARDMAKAKLLKPACSKGHLLEGENLYLHPSGRRVCKTCRRVWKNNFRSNGSNSRKA